MASTTPLTFTTRSEEAPSATSASLALATAARDKRCNRCALSVGSVNVCGWGNGPVPTRGMVVLDNPTEWEERDGITQPGVQYLRRSLLDVELDMDELYVTNAVKCPPPDSKGRMSMFPGEDRDKLVAAARKACAVYLDAELAAVQPKFVLAVGVNAYYYFKHTTGVIKGRGQEFAHVSGATVIPTIHPSYVLENPAQHAAFIADLAKFKRALEGNIEPPAVEMVPVLTLAEWRAAEAELREDDGKVLTFDLETRGFKDADPSFSKVWCAALTRGRRGEKGIRVFGVPLEHPGVDLTDEDRRELIRGVCDLVLGARVSGHNVKFDVRHLRRLAERYG